MIPQTYTATEIAKMQGRAIIVAHKRLQDLRIPTTKVDVTLDVRLGNPPRELAEAAREVEADLIVVASHGYGPIRRAVLGSVTSSLIRVAQCPVLIVGEGRPGGDNFNKVLAAVDLSSVSRSILAHAVQMAAFRFPKVWCQQ